VADRLVSHTMRSARRNPFSANPTLDEELERLGDSESGFEVAVASRDLAEKLAAQLAVRLSPLGYRMFVLLFVDEETVENIEALTGLRPDAIYAWRSRLRRAIHRLASELAPETSCPQPNPREGRRA
jgi:hypothetical protein